MYTPKVYPEELRMLVHELYNKQQVPMYEVVAIIQKQYPKYGKRIDANKLHSIARQLRKRNKMTAKNQSIARAASKPRKKYRKTGKRRLGKHNNLIDQIKNEARKLRQKDYTWGAIVDELKVRFPEWNAIPPGSLAILVKGKKQHRQRTMHSYNYTANKNGYKISVTGPSGVVMSLDATATQVEHLVRMFLEE